MLSLNQDHLVVESCAFHGMTWTITSGYRYVLSVVGVSRRHHAHYYALAPKALNLKSVTCKQTWRSWSPTEHGHPKVKAIYMASPHYIIRTPLEPAVQLTVSYVATETIGSRYTLLNKGHIVKANHRVLIHRATAVTIAKSQPKKPDVYICDDGNYQYKVRQLDINIGWLLFWTLQMSPGQPHRLLIPNWDLSAPVVVYNGKKFDQPILVQLADEGENPTTEAGIRVQLAKDPGIKVCDNDCSLVTVNWLIFVESVHNHLKKSLTLQVRLCFAISCGLICHFSQKEPVLLWIVCRLYRCLWLALLDQ